MAGLLHSYPAPSPLGGSGYGPKLADALVDEEKATGLIGYVQRCAPTGHVLMGASLTCFHPTSPSFFFARELWQIALPPLGIVAVIY